MNYFIFFWYQLIPILIIAIRIFYKVHKANKHCLLLNFRINFNLGEKSYLCKVIQAPRSSIQIITLKVNTTDKFTTKLGDSISQFLKLFFLRRAKRNFISTAFKNLFPIAHFYILKLKLLLSLSFSYKSFCPCSPTKLLYLAVHLSRKEKNT